MPDDGAGPARSVSYTLELHSVAHFIPTWTLDANALQGLPDTPSGSEPYVAWVGARVDTVTIIITQNIARPARWSVCDLNHARDAHTPYWNFANGQMRDISVVRWGPGTGSWAEVTRLADSVATSH